MKKINIFAIAASILSFQALCAEPSPSPECVTPQNAIPEVEFFKGAVQPVVEELDEGGGLWQKIRFHYSNGVSWKPPVNTQDKLLVDEGVDRKSLAAATIYELVNNNYINAHLRKDKVLWDAVNSDPHLKETFKDDKEYESQLKNGVDLHFLYAEQSGASGYTVGEHTSRVLNNYFSQRQYWDFSKLHMPKGVGNIDHFMTLVLAFHDIGKSIAAQSGDKDYEIRYSVPIIRRLMTDIGYTKEATELAGALVVVHEDLGTVLKAKSQGKDVDLIIPKIQEHISHYAIQSGMSPRDFFQLMKLFYNCDAGAYPNLKKAVFNSKPGEAYQPKDMADVNAVEQGLSTDVPPAPPTPVIQNVPERKGATVLKDGPLPAHP